MLELRDGEVEDHAKLAEEGGGADEAIVDSVRVAAEGVQPSAEAEGARLEKRRQLTGIERLGNTQQLLRPFEIGELECSLDSLDKGPLDDERVDSQLRAADRARASAKHSAHRRPSARRAGRARRESRSWRGPEARSLFRATRSRRGVARAPRARRARCERARSRTAKTGADRVASRLFLGRVLQRLLPAADHVQELESPARMSDSQRRSPTPSRDREHARSVRALRRSSAMVNDAEVVHGA